MADIRKLAKIKLNERPRFSILRSAAQAINGGITEIRSGIKTW